MKNLINKLKNSISNITKQQWISFIGVFLITIGDYICFSCIEAPLRHYIGIPVLVIGTIVLLVDVIKGIKNKEYSKNQIKIFWILAAAGLLIWHRISVFYPTLIMVMHFLNKGLRYLFKCLFISMLIGFSAIILLTLVNIIPSEPFHRTDVIKRYSLGFIHPNATFKYYIALLMCGAIVLKNNKIFLLSTLPVGVALFYITDSRMGIGMLILFVLLSVLPRSIKKKISFNSIIPYAFLGLTIISVLTAIIFANNDFMNVLLNTRPMIWNEYLKEIGFLGRFTHIETLPIDNVYIHILCFGGIFGFVAYTVAYFVGFNRSGLTKDNYNFFVIFFITLIYGFIENIGRQNECFTLILLLFLLLDKEKVHEIEDEYIDKEKK